MNVLTEFFKKLNIQHFFACGVVMLILSFYYQQYILLRIFGFILMAPFTLELVVQIIFTPFILLKNWLSVRKIKNKCRSEKLYLFLQYIYQFPSISSEDIAKYNHYMSNNSNFILNTTDVNILLSNFILQKTGTHTTNLLGNRKDFYIVNTKIISKILNL